MNSRPFNRGACATVVAALLTVAATRSLAGDAHQHAAPPPAAPTPAAAPAAVGKAPAAATVPAADAVKLLADGNARFAAGGATRPHQGQARLCDTFANGQHPYAAVLSCADSRVPPELVFDAGIGDLFVVRVAGNVADVDEIGTLEYGVEHLGINAILVMGHTKCGAVTAVVDKAHVTRNIEKLVDNIVPAADDARRAFPQLGGPQLIGKAIEMNVRRQMADTVANSDVIRDRVKAGTLKVVGGVYDLHTGEVNWVEAVPSSAAVAATPAPRAEPAAPVAAPAKADAHGHSAPAVGKASSSHDDGHDAPHAPAAKDAHSAASHDAADAHDEPAHADKHEAAAATPAKKENFLALGGLVAGGCGVSYGVLHFLKGKAPIDATATTDATPEPAGQIAVKPATT